MSCPHENRSIQSVIYLFIKYLEIKKSIKVDLLDKICQHNILYGLSIGERKYSRSKSIIFIIFVFFWFGW